MNEQGCKGFFYPDRRGDSKVVLEKLCDAAKISLTLVQLLDNEMFVAGQDVASNYCYWEYQRAIEYKMSLLFVFPYAEPQELLPVEDRQDELDEWYQCVSKADLRLLPVAPTNNLVSLGKIHSEIKKLATQIKSLRDTAIERVP